MQVGDLVKFRGSIGVIIELHSDYRHGTAEVQWIEGDRDVISRNVLKAIEQTRKVLKVIEQNGHFMSST
tara:strand:+ start:6986 stop:7192 length:207 start_codon:yes stop_codon:yes gene_type:complete